MALPEMNSLEVLLVQNDLKQMGINSYTMQPGNNCIWVNYGLVHAYYIFREGKIFDVQYD